MNLYERFFSSIYDPFMKSVEAASLGERRRNLLSDLRGEILEIGTGTGVNFQYYHHDVKITSVEPSVAMYEYAAEKIKEHPLADNIQHLPHALEELEFNQDIAGREFDHIVCTLVLCTVRNLNKSVELIKKHLRPEGTLVVLEHIKSHDNFAAGFQKAFTPLWKHAAEGCHLDRPTDRYLKENGFKVYRREEYFNYVLPFYMAELKPVTD